MPALPEITQEFTADTAPFVRNLQAAITQAERFARAVWADVAAVKALDAALSSLDNKNIAVNVAADIAKATAELEALQQKINSLHGKDINIGINQITKELGDHAAAVSVVTDVVNEHVNVSGDQANALQVTANAVSELEARFRPLVTAENQATAAIISFGLANREAIAEANRIAGAVTGETESLAANVNAVKKAEAALISFGIENSAVLSTISQYGSALEDASAGLTRFAVSNTNTVKELAATGSAIDRQAFALRQDGQAGGAAAAGIMRFAMANNDAISKIANSAIVVTDSMAREAIGLDSLNKMFAYYTPQIRQAAAESHVLSAETALAAFSFGKMAMTAAGTRWAAIATGIHWVVAGGAEILAVVVPALVALGSGLMVAMQGAQNGQMHFQALYTTVEATANMFHQTVGSVLGLRSALQKAQDAANPGVYEVFGAAINIAKQNFQGLANTGLQVMHIFDRFSARVVADFQAGLGGQVHGLLSGMVSDLVTLGQIFGNVGHAILNFAAAMPGLAKVLFGIVDAVSQVILAISSMPKWIITTFMALEEFYRWGGLAVAIIAALAGAIARFVSSGFGIALIFTRVVEVGRVLMTILPAIIGIIAGNLTKGLATVALQLSGSTTAIGQFIGNLATKLGTASGAVSGFAAKILSSIGELSAWQVLVGVIAVAALGFLIYKLATATTSTERFITTMQQGLDSIKNGMNIPGKIINDLALNMQKLSAAQKQVATQGQFVGGVVSRYTNQLSSAGISANQLRANQQHLTNELGNFYSWTSKTAGLVHTSWIGAIIMANEAGVKWSDVIHGNAQNMRIAQIQVMDLAAGYRSMGAPMSAVGADMTALGIQAGLQKTQVQNLNAAWDQFMQTITAGTSGMAGFRQSLANIGAVTSQSTDLLSKSGGQMSLSIGQIATSLQHFSGTSSQVWQNFNNTITGSAQQLIDWMRTAGAMGASTGPQLIHSVADIVNAFIPMASKSKMAQAELMALWNQSGHTATSFGQLKQQVAATHPSFQNLNSIIARVTHNMSNMSHDAQALGTVVQQDMVATMGRAAIASSGLYQAIDTLDNALHNNASGTTILSAKQAALNIIMQDFHMTAKQANQLLQVNSNMLGTNAQQAYAAATANQTVNSVLQQGHMSRQQFNTDIQNAMQKAPTLTNDISRMAQMIQHHTQTTQAGASARQQLIKDFEKAGLTAQGATKLVNGLITMMGKIPHHELINIIMNGSGHYSISGAAHLGFSGAAGRAASRAGQFAGGSLQGTRTKHGAHGGFVEGPGTSTSDSIPARLSHGEYVVRAAAVAHYGKGMMDAINAKHFAQGGLVEQGNKSVLTGQYATGMFMNFQTSMINAMVSSMQGAMRASQAAAMASLAGGIGAGHFGGGSVAAFIRAQAARLGWTGGQWQALYNVIMRESGFNPYAVNPSSGAAGIFQSLGHGYVRLGDVAGQTAWGLNYIRCVPLETQILTEDGWKSYKEVKVGDKTIGFDPRTGTSRWTKIIAIHNYDFAPIVRMANSRFEVLSTPNHRWLTETTKQVDQRKMINGKREVTPGTTPISYSELGFTETQNLHSRHKLRLAAKHEDTEGLPLSAVEAEILGWLLTDGSIHYGANNRGGKRGKLNVTIAQSKPAGVRRLKELLSEIPHSLYVSPPKDSIRKDGVTIKAQHSMHRFRLKSAYARDLLSRSGCEKDPEQMVLNMSTMQRDAFLEGLIAGDGHISKRGGSPVFCQNEGAVLNAALMAIYLAGHYGHVTDSGGQKHISLSKGTIKGDIHREEAECAPVWCVTTELGTWTCRQNSEIFLTGNSRYGNPANAWAHEASYGWYDKGGTLPPGLTLAMNATGRPERVLPPGGDSGPVHIHMNMDGKQFAELILPHIHKAQWQYDWRNSSAATYLKPR